MADHKKPAKGRKRPSRPRQGAEVTKEDILRIATEEFAEHGLTGARVDAIARRTRTSKRMIYYYFGGKEALYAAVLERAYGAIRTVESELHLELLQPVDALRRMIESTFDYDEAHPEFIRLVTIENINKARHMRRMQSMRAANRSVLQVLDDILARGYAEGVFKRKVDSLDLHLMISAFCFFRVSNRHTFGSIFGIDLATSRTRVLHRQLLCDVVLKYLSMA